MDYVEEKEIKKTFNEISDFERNIIREYDSWVKSNTDEIDYKITQLDFWHARAKTHKIDHLLVGYK